MLTSQLLGHVINYTQIVQCRENDQENAHTALCTGLVA
jgi:hypothetical protein